MEFCQELTPTSVRSVELSSTELSKLFTNREYQYNDEQKDNTPKIYLCLPVVTRDKIMRRRTIKAVLQFKKKYMSRVISKKCTYIYKPLHEQIYLSRAIPKQMAKLSFRWYRTEFEILLKQITTKYFVIIPANSTKLLNEKYKSYPDYCKGIFSDFPKGKYRTKINYSSPSCSKKEMISHIAVTKAKQNCNTISRKCIIANAYTLKECMSSQSLLRNIQNGCNFFEEKKIITLFKHSNSLSFLYSSTQKSSVPIMSLFIIKNNDKTKKRVAEQQSKWDSHYTLPLDLSSIKKHIFFSNKYYLSNVYYNQSCKFHNKIVEKNAISWNENFKDYIDILIDNLIRKRNSHTNNWKYFTLQLIPEINVNLKRQCSHYSVVTDRTQFSDYCFLKGTISNQSLSTYSNKSGKKKESINIYSAFKRLSSIVYRVRCVPDQVESKINLSWLKENVVYQTQLSSINTGNISLLRDTTNRNTKYFKKLINIVTHNIYIIESSHDINKPAGTNSELLKIKKKTSGLFLDIHKHAEYKICLQSLFKDASKSSCHKASRNISFELPEDNEPSRSCIIPSHYKHTCCINQHGLDDSQYMLSNCHHNKKKPRKYTNKLCNTNSPIKVELPTSNCIDCVSNSAQCQIDSDKSIQTSYGRCFTKNGKENKPKLYRDIIKPRKIRKTLPIRQISSKRRKFCREPQETVIEIENYKKDPSTNSNKCEDKKVHRNLWNKICQKFLDKHRSAQRTGCKITPTEQYEVVTEGDEEQYELTFSDFQCMDESQLKDILCELKKATFPNKLTPALPSSSTKQLKSSFDTESSDICGGEDIMICFDDPCNFTCPSSSSF